MVKTIQPQAFEVEIGQESRLSLVAFLKRNERLASQMEALKEVERGCGGRVRCLLFDADYLDTAMERFAVKGTPTFILFGKEGEKGRLIGESDTAVLRDFLDAFCG